MAVKARISELGGRLADMWARLMESQADEAAISTTALNGAPLIWLLGKVQSGKTSIVKAITGCADAEIGSGFRPCTRTACAFDFPEEAPLIRFLDTRGLGEAGYDPAEDIAEAMGRAHMLLVVVRALDHQLDELVSTLRNVRSRHPDWPVVIAQTCLHEAYVPGAQHVMPYPFSCDHPSASSHIPESLSRSLAHQREVFSDIGGSGVIRFVPIDFTQPGDGLDPQNYGLDALLDAIGDAAPASIAGTLRHLRQAGLDQLAQKTHSLILGHASVAAAADIVPVAGAVAVPSVQAKLLHTLGSFYDVAWDRRMLHTFAACLGGSIVARLLAGFGVRQLVKLVPVYGQTAGAAAAAATSFATTYALGKAADVFLARRKAGEDNAAAVADAYREALSTAFSLARERGLKSGKADEAADAT